MNKGFFLYGLIGLLLLSCNGEEKPFARVSSSESGINFKNAVTESVEFNIFNYMYFYNGAGVAAGDLNNDGLPDLYFSSNQEDNKLYLNQGNFRFIDITEEAGVAGFKGWTTGVTMADVNGDDQLDIYVCYLGDYLIYKGRNQLFINQGLNEKGIPTFRDESMEYGLDLVGFSTQASFFDYDRDGDLDMYMLNHSLHQNGTFGKSGLRNQVHPLAGDRLMRNDNGRFVDATSGSGIFSSVIGYGLGVVVSDVNLDGWPDIYVGNDFHENDYLYLNQKDGTFKEVVEQSMNHTSRYTMGVDFADMNNDAFPDLIAMDMLPEDPLILKASQAEEPYDVYNFKINFGYNHQFARNVLQLNNQDGTFSEIALMAGVGATDWSWATLFADFNLDGNKDIFVANGIKRRSNDLDYINFITVDSVQMSLKRITEKEVGYFKKMPEIKLANYLYINNGDSTFSNKSVDWGIGEKTFSNGAAYADLDSDGDLDIITNNLEDEASLYRNNFISEKSNKDKKEVNYLKVKLVGERMNTRGIGAKVFIYTAGGLQMQECNPTRGYQSSVDYQLIFGTGKHTKVDSLLVIWNQGKFQRMSNINGNQLITIKESDAAGSFDYLSFHQSSPIFVKATEEFALPYKHKENHFVEFNREALIPHMMSAEGPAFAVADVNGDGLEDIFAGGAKREKASLFLQSKKGGFISVAQPDIEKDSIAEDVSAVFTDVDGDKDKDLFVVSGGNEFSGKSNFRLPRLYLNDGTGNFTRSEGLPKIFLTGSCVSVNDIDGDGDADFFLGALTKPWHYGIPQDSYILLNDGKGNFTDATDSVAPQLRQFGFIKDAIWADMNGDKVKDLVIAAEWRPITIFINKNNKLELLDIKESGLEFSNGWWNKIREIDFDNDGDLDLIAGNAGLNSKLKATAEKPVRMYVSDFDRNDSTDQILTHFVGGKEYPFHTRDEMTKQMPFLKKRYLSYKKFAEATVYDMFPKETLEKSEKQIAYIFETCVVENLGNGKFKLRPLPRAAQISQVNAIEVDDFNGDGKTDIMIAGNYYPINIQMGRDDASFGLILLNEEKGGFKPLSPRTSGISIRGEVRCFRKIKVNDKVYYLAVRNNDSVEAFTLK